jgi:hypothetical protein
MGPRRSTVAALAAFFCLTPSLCAAEGDDRDAWLRRVDASRRGYELYAARAWESYAAHNAAFRRSAPGTPANYAEDPTLRRGDVVMTDSGMVVYAGADGGAARFTALADWRGDARRREDLLELQKASLAEPSGHSR